MPPEELFELRDILEGNEYAIAKFVAGIAAAKIIDHFSVWHWIML